MENIWMKKLILKYQYKYFADTEYVKLFSTAITVNCLPWLKLLLKVRLEF